MIDGPDGSESRTCDVCGQSADYRPIGSLCPDDDCYGRIAASLGGDDDGGQ